MPPIPPDIELARIRQKLEEGLGRELTCEERRLLGLSKLVIKPERAQSQDKAADGQPKKQGD